MRFKMVKTMLIVILVVGSSLAQRIPAGVLQIIDAMKKDSTIAFGFCDAKKWLHLDNF